MAAAGTIAVDELTDEDIKDAIAWLDTDLSTLQAALKIKRGPLVADFRKYAVEIIKRRGLLAEVLDGRALRERSK